MALSLTNTLGNICTEALALLNVIDDENAVPSEDMGRAAKQLQLMLRTWQTEGVTLWMRRELPITTVPSTASYDLSVNTISADQIIQVVILENGDTIQTPLREISRQHYLTLTDRTIEGKPTYYYPQFTGTDEDITLWPVPDDVYSLKVDYKLRFTGQDERTDVIELPDYWLEAAVWNLAERLLTPYGKDGTPMAQKVMGRAKDLYDTAAAFDVIQNGGGEVQFTPEWR